MKKKIAILLPYKEIYSPNFSGAASIWVKDYNNLSKFSNLSTIYGNLEKFLKPNSKNFKNIIIKKFIFSKTNQYLNFFYKSVLKNDFSIIEIHNRPEYINFLFKKKIKAKFIFFFHNNPQKLRGSKSIKERLNILNKTDKIFFVSD